MRRYFLCTLVLSSCLSLPSLFAQKWEFNPYAGGYWPNSLRDGGTIGLRGGLFVSPDWEVEWHGAYLTPLDIRRTNSSARATLYEIGGAYNFRVPEYTPFVSFGVGGLGTIVRHVQSLDVVGARSLQQSTGDMFLNFSYGGGLKMIRAWGPAGLRFEFRGRTIPNFYGATTTWPEFTTGLILNWGER